jgi:hypothetical protein
VAGVSEKGQVRGQIRTDLAPAHRPLAHWPLLPFLKYLILLQKAGRFYGEIYNKAIALQYPDPVF